MADELNIGGANYILSKRAAGLTGYTQDYIGQLARSGQIEARRVSGLWYISLESLKAYKEKADTYVPQPPAPIRARDENEISVSFDGRTFITAARAAKLTGYHQDYIGQLAREGKVLSRQVGNRWYIDQDGLRAHKEEKDRLLAAVQVQSVGLVKAAPVQQELEGERHPLLTYFSEEHKDVRRPVESFEVPEGSELPVLAVTGDVVNSVPVKVVRREGVRQDATGEYRNQSDIFARTQARASARRGMVAENRAVFAMMLGATTVTVVLMVALYADPLEEGGVFSGVRGASFASVSAAVDIVGIFLEKIFAHDVSYRAEQYQ